MCFQRAALHTHTHTHTRRHTHAHAHTHCPHPPPRRSSPRHSGPTDMLGVECHDRCDAVWDQPGQSQSQIGSGQLGSLDLPFGMHRCSAGRFGSISTRSGRAPTCCCSATPTCARVNRAYLPRLFPMCGVRVRWKLPGARANHESRCDARPRRVASTTSGTGGRSACASQCCFPIISARRLKSWSSKPRSSG